MGKLVSSINSMFALGNYNINLTIDTENPNYVMDEVAFINATGASQIIIHKKENAIAGSPFGSPFGLRAIEWVGEN